MSAMDLRSNIFLGSFVEALSPMGINRCEGYAWLQQVTLPQWDTGSLFLWGGESDWTQVCHEIKSENSSLHSINECQELGDLGPSSFLPIPSFLSSGISEELRACSQPSSSLWTGGGMQIKPAAACDSDAECFLCILHQCALRISFSPLEDFQLLVPS